MTGRSLLCASLALAEPAIARTQVVQNVQGDVAHFGEGFTAISERRVDFRLLRPANVVLFWVTPDGGIELFFPVRSRDKTFRRAGGNAISVSDIPSPIQAPVIVHHQRCVIACSDGEPADRGARTRRQQRRQRLLGLADERCVDHRPRRAAQARADVARGGRAHRHRPAGARARAPRHAVGAVCGGRRVALTSFPWPLR